MNNMNPKALCFGEILWDVFPDQTIIGGAPFNVAQRLHSFGVETSMISTIGNDDLGNQVKQFMTDKGLSPKGLSLHDTLPTGQVKVLLDRLGVAQYTIEDPAAWDEIKLWAEVLECIEAAEVLVFGSLAMRHLPNQLELNQLLLPQIFKVFDVNLRPPHLDLLWIKQTMRDVNMIKMNEEELDFLFGSTLNFQSTDTIDQKCQKLSGYDELKVWCITLGGEGARLYCNGVWYSHSGYIVDVVDTVGAGDSFLAALIYGLIIDKQPPEKALDFAVRIGSIVAGRAGANPEISAGDQAILRLK